MYWGCRGKFGGKLARMQNHSHLFFCALYSLLLFFHCVFFFFNSHIFQSKNYIQISGSFRSLLLLLFSFMHFILRQIFQAFSFKSIDVIFKIDTFSTRHLIANLWSELGFRHFNSLSSISLVLSTHSYFQLQTPFRLVIYFSYIMCFIPRINHIHINQTTSHHFNYSILLQLLLHTKLS